MNTKVDRFMYGFCTVVAVLALLSLLVSVPGCSILPDHLTPEQLAVRAKITARTGVNLALTLGIEDEQERSDAAGKVVFWADIVRDCLETEDVSLTDALDLFSDLFLGSVPEKSRPYVQSALDALAIYLSEYSLESPLTADVILVLRAFLDGAIEGASPHIIEV